MEGRNKETTCKLGTRLSITRRNSQIHLTEKNSDMLTYAMGEFGPEHFFSIYEDEEKIFQNTKKQLFQGICSNYHDLNKNICIILQPWISLRTTVRQYFIQL